MNIVKSIRNTFARTQVIDGEAMKLLSLDPLGIDDVKKSEIRGLIVSLESNDAVTEQLVMSEKTARNLDKKMRSNKSQGTRGTRVLATGTRKGDVVTITNFHVIARGPNA